MRQFKCPPRLESWVTPCSILYFSWRGSQYEGGGGGGGGGIDPDEGILPCANRMGEPFIELFVCSYNYIWFDVL